MKRKIKERLRKKKLIWENLCLSYDYNKKWIYLWGDDSGIDLTIKGYYKDDILCLVNKHISFFLYPLNCKIPFTFFKKFILEPTMEGLERINFKGNVGFEKMEFEQLNNYIRIMLKRNNIQFQENEKYIYAEIK